MELWLLIALHTTAGASQIVPIGDGVPSTERQVN